MRYSKVLAFCLIVSLISSCDIFSSNDRLIPAETFDVIVYGEVENIDTSTSPSPIVETIVHREGCDSEGSPAARGSLNEFRSFNFVYHSDFGNVDMTCHKAVLMLDDSVLAGPKELDVNFRTECPLDSTRVDFRFLDDL